MPVLTIFTAEPYYERFPDLVQDKKFMDSFESILVFYHEKYYRKGDAIYIYRWLDFDDDLLANYTRKALNRCGKEIPESKGEPVTIDRILGVRIYR